MGKATGLRITRLFTKPGEDPLDSVEWSRRDSRITNPDGSVVFEMKDAEVPSTWSQVAADIMVSKYFRKAGAPQRDAEGRIIEMDFGGFLFFNVYFPNGQMSAERLQYKLDFYEAFFAYADACRKRGRSLVICGDYNTAHNEIDLANPKANEKTSGFLRIERDWLDRIVERGYVDTFRHFHPDTVKYSWWTYRFKARERNIGWRIDYFFVTNDLIASGRVKEAFIDNDVHGSDHCPIGLVVEL